MTLGAVLEGSGMCIASTDFSVVIYMIEVMLLCTERNSAKFAPVQRGSEPEVRLSKNPSTSCIAVPLLPLHSMTPKAS